MTLFPYIFNQTPEQLRCIGARGGKAQARNRRGRLRTQPEPRTASLPPALPLAQSTAQDIALLDAQYPWLCGAGKRSSPKANLLTRT